MIIPIRCFTCGKILKKYKKFCELKKEGVPINEIFKQIKLKRYCCRKNMLTHVDIVEKLN